MFPFDMLWWFYKNVRDTDGKSGDWGTGYGGGYGGRGGGYGGGGYGGFGESNEIPNEEPKLNEEDNEEVENLEEFVRMEIRGILAENFKPHNKDE